MLSNYRRHRKGLKHWGKRQYVAPWTPESVSALTHGGLSAQC